MLQTNIFDGQLGCCQCGKPNEADLWSIPWSKRVYLIVDQKMNVIYRKDMGFGLLPDQTQTLLGEIDRHLH